MNCTISAGIVNLIVCITGFVQVRTSAAHYAPLVLLCHT